MARCWTTQQTRRALSALIILGIVWTLPSLRLSAQDKKADEPKTEAPKTNEPAKPEPEEEVPLPKKDQMLRNLPSKADLLTKPPVDWVILKNDDVLVVKPIAPRPRTLEFMATKRKEFANPP